MPLTNTSPESTGYLPNIASANSVLPEPSSPVTPNISPGATEKEISVNVGLEVKCLTSTTLFLANLSGGAILVVETS